jgi:hypothetical protein
MRAYCEQLAELHPGFRFRVVSEHEGLDHTQDVAITPVRDLFRAPVVSKPASGAGQVDACVVTLIGDWGREGVSEREIARRLEEAGYRAPRGSRWYPSTVHRVKKRALAAV